MQEFNVTIRRFEEKDIPNKVKWINDVKNNKFLHYELPIEYEKTLNWYRSIKNKDTRYDAVIMYDNIEVGIIGLLNIDRMNQKAEYYITIGEEQYKGKGIAYKASKLLLKYGFNELKLNKIYLFTEVNNLGAQRLFEKLGFKKEGKLVQDLIIKDRKIDRYIYGICKGDFIC